MTSKVGTQLLYLCRTSVSDEMDEQTATKAKKGSCK